MTVNNPIEAEKLWREGAVRPLCVCQFQPAELGQRSGRSRSAKNAAPVTGLKAQQAHRDVCAW